MIVNIRARSNGPISEIKDSLNEINDSVNSVGSFFREVLYWLNPVNLYKELDHVFDAGLLDVPLIIATIIGILLLMGGAKWPKKWLFWGWVVFWILRGVVFA